MQRNFNTPAFIAVMSVLIVLCVGGATMYFWPRELFSLLGVEDARDLERTSALGKSLAVIGLILIFILVIAHFVPNPDLQLNDEVEPDSD